MENLDYKELMEKAENGQLTITEVNKLVLFFNKRFDDKDREDRNRDKKIAEHSRGFRDIEEEYPLLPPEADDLSRAVQRKGVKVLGGKDTPAYKNTNLRKRLYQDIYMEVKRQYGLINDAGRQLSYKKLKRKYLKGALTVVDEYEAPIALMNDIEAENELDGME